jgi:hypothetical protein
MIRIDTIWLAIEPMDMRAGTETALARVVAVFGAAKPHCAYLFANRRANRMKVLVHGRMPPASSPIWRRSFTTSARAALANMLEISSATGTESWSAMTSLATRQALNWALQKSAA